MAGLFYAPKSTENINLDQYSLNEMGNLGCIRLEHFAIWVVGKSTYQTTVMIYLNTVFENRCSDQIVTNEGSTEVKVKRSDFSFHWFERAVISPQFLYQYAIKWQYHVIHLCFTSLLSCEWERREQCDQAACPFVVINSPLGKTPNAIMPCSALVPNLDY